MRLDAKFVVATRPLRTVLLRAVLLVVVSCSAPPDDNQTVLRCDEDSDCSPGHACEGRSCSVDCSVELCRAAYGERADCVGGEHGSCARSVPCSRYLECADTEQICEVHRDRCFSVEGECESVPDCPSWGLPPSVAEARCDGGSCRIAPPGTPELTFLPSDKSITIDSPYDAQIFPSESAITFNWSVTPKAVSALVLKDIPQNKAQLERFAIWGVVRGAGDEAAGVATWAEGSAIQNGDWLNASQSAPEGRILFLLVLGMENGGLQAHSHLRRFAVRSGWREVGEECQAQDDGSNPCAHPARMQTCIGGRCRIVCSSDTDCATTTEMGSCNRPIPETDDFRVCSIE